MQKKIFLSYRHQDSKGETLAVMQHLLSNTTDLEVFLDVGGGIEVGSNFLRSIEEAVGKADLMICIIGSRWLELSNAAALDGRENQTDFVRVEIHAALVREIPIIPILLDNAEMPDRESLPPELSLLASKQAVRVRHDCFIADMGAVLSAIRRVIGGGRSNYAATSAAILGGFLASGLFVALGYESRDYFLKGNDAPISITKIYARANDFLGGADPTSFLGLLTTAEKEIWMVGTSFHISIDTFQQQIIQKVSEGVKFKLVMLNPNSPALSSMAKTFEVSEEELSAYCTSGIRTARRLIEALQRSTRENGGSFEVRLSNVPIYMRMYFFDPEDRKGRTYIIPQANLANSQGLPGFLIGNERGISHKQYYYSLKKNVG
ncbi:MAG: toll/interleukin-1 receptor domain-containing protein [Alphaproteobacteria bacterium]|nr:toll/interleukin-1 receptor domain-containing protein [Alphaproteobacteria bacterium]